MLSKILSRLFGHVEVWYVWYVCECGRCRVRAVVYEDHYLV